ncbi:hypothetical protein QZH41_006190 [Actinostola sp. cb2023]|nr:hypothetical protein QZH41_006190 [Actinostola sp. cb2023]
MLCKTFSNHHKHKFHRQFQHKHKFHRQFQHKHKFHRQFQHNLRMDKFKRNLNLLNSKFNKPRPRHHKMSFVITLPTRPYQKGILNTPYNLSSDGFLTFGTIVARYRSHPNAEVVCDWEGNPTSWAGPLPSVEMVSRGKSWASPALLKFRDPESFVADYITDLPRYVGLDHFQTTFDDKSGYDHVRLHPASRKYFGLEWSGCTLMTEHVGQLRLPQNSTCRFSGYQLAEMASFIACSVLLSLGYFIGLKKSVLVPQTVIRFLGYLCNSHKQAFILPEDKRLKFSTLRESILENKSVSLKNLQKFTGKTTSFALLVPAAKLFSNNAYQAISRAQKSSSTSIRLSDPLRNEILHWRFLDSWSGFLPWKEEKHVCVSVHSDASNTGWGGVLSSPGQPTQEIRGYWDEESRRFPIAVKEAKALLATLQSLLQGVYNVRLDVFVDNKVVVDSWNRQTSKSPSITGVMKDLFAFSTKHNISLSVQFVPSKLNIADSLSRTVSDLDCTLSPTAWRTIESAFGPHSIDLMALPDNVRCNAAGRPLRFLSEAIPLRWFVRSQRFRTANTSRRKRLPLPTVYSHWPSP